MPWTIGVDRRRKSESLRGTCTPNTGPKLQQPFVMYLHFSRQLWIDENCNTKVMSHSRPDDIHLEVRACFAYFLLSFTCICTVVHVVSDVKWYFKDVLSTAYNVD